MIEIDTRLRAARGIEKAARGIEKTETEAAGEAFRQLKQRGHPERPPPLCSDGFGGIDQALIEVYGRVPPYQGRGRPPRKKRPVETWQYLQLVKRGDARGRVVGTEARVVFGEPDRVRARFGETTAYIERTHLTMRQMNARLVRKGLGFSKALWAHRWAAAWDDAL
ncbi:MAG TPA: hypothetical protein VGW38_17545 [Chloroflexota bacterium]|nr:hypothetical protein [Chloroflexota bacterium]